jgi:NAD(P)-dependent dehydrogenase (short-subunit alcohol dehydrogenase family)
MPDENSLGTSTGLIGRLFTLAGEVALVADYGRTSGLAICEILLEAGATVVLAENDEVVCATARSRFAAAGERFRCVQVDHFDDAAVDRLFADIDREFSRLDVFVSAFGYYTNGEFAAQDRKTYAHCLDINLHLPIAYQQRAVDLMISRKIKGRIVSVSSISVLVPVRNGNVAYSASRGASASAMRCIALDCAPAGIRANMILCGNLQGDFVVYDPKTLDELDGGTTTGPMTWPHRLPLGVGSLEDIAAAVLYLATPASGYVTGQCLQLEGGFVLA